MSKIKEAFMPKSPSQGGNITLVSQWLISL